MNLQKLQRRRIMKIEVMGPGCPFCKILYKRTKEVVKENNMDAEVEHVTGFKSFLKYFPMTPVLIVDCEIRHRGR